jgi:integrase
VEIAEAGKHSRRADGGGPGRLGRGPGRLGGPLFVRLNRAAGPGHPSLLDAGNAARASQSLGLRAGRARGTNLHGLRHQGITRALDLANGDVWRVKEFSRHAKLETLLRYSQ